MKRFFHVIFAFICTLLFPAFVCDSSLLFSYSPMPLIFMAGIYWLLDCAGRQRWGKRIQVYTHILGSLLSVMTAFGCYLEAQGSIPYKSLRLITAVAIYSHVFANILCLLWTYLQRWELSLSKNGNQSRAFQLLSRGLDSLLSRPFWVAAVLLLCWMPCYISAFPGNFYCDAAAEFAQYTQGYFGDFPMLHSVLIIAFLNVGHFFTGTYNAGIAAYVIVQILLLALLFTHILCHFRQSGINAVLLGALTAFYAAFPLIHVLVTTSVRDVLFSGLLVYTVFQIYQLARCPESFFHSVRQPLVLGITVALTVLSRDNGTGLLLFYVLCVVGLGVLLGCRRKSRRGAGIFAVSMVGGYLLIHLALAAVCQPYTPAQLSSSLTFFTQPLARAYFYENDSWTEDQKARFEEYFDMENLRYVPENGDGTKGCCYVDKNTLKPFLRFWVSMGIRYPGCYMDAILANTRQMWFPGSVVDGYVESGDWHTEKTLFFFLDEIEKPGEHRLLLPKVRDFYQKLGLSITFEKIPVVSMLFSIGFQFWLLLNCFFYASYRRYKHLYAPLAVLLSYTILSALVPLVCLRYFAALFFSFPVTIVFTLQPGKTGESQIH